MVEPVFNPYVGPRAFEARDSDNFFGRDEETRQLTSLVIARRVVLFHAQSGAGKTSLLQASLIPRLTERKKVTVLPVSRVGGDFPPGLDRAQVKNIYVFNTLLNLLGGAARPGELAGLTLREGLRDYLDTGSDDERPRPCLFILDQLEELFTTHPDRYPDRADFFLQLQHCLADHPQLSLLLVMREDYIARLDSYAAQLPDRLRTRFRMERLSYAAALSAVHEPAARAGRPFAKGVAEALVDNLRRVQPGRSRDGRPAPQSVLGTYVEPVHLQIVCQQLWANLPSGRSNILAEDVQEFGDVDQALTDFYETTLITVLAQTEVSQRRLREWFDTHLITSARTRGLVYRAEEETEGLPNPAVDILNEAYIIRAEVRGNDKWYELAHDRLVEPILAANRAWKERQQNPFTLAAESWLAAGKDPEKLYKGAQLKEAQAHAKANPDDLSELEREFIRVGLEVDRLQAARRLRLVLFGSLALLVLLAGLAGWALNNAVLARQQAARADVARGAAESFSADAEAARKAAIQERDRAATAEADAIQQRVTAEAASTLAIQQKEIAESQATAAAEAWAELAANLEAQVVAARDTPTPITPTPVASTPSSPSSPQPPLLTPTSIPDQGATATAAALRTVEAQLTQVRAKQTAAAEVPTPTPTPTATPTPAARVNFPPPGQIVFSSNRSSHVDLYSMDGDGSDQRRLTFSLGAEASYSPVTDKIAFSRPRIDGIVSLYMMDSDGQGELGIDERFWDNWEPTFSPDGRRVAYVSSRENRDWEIYSMRVGESDINPIHLSCQNIPEDWKKWGPAWSPTDDERIAFVVQGRGDSEFEGQADIWLMDDDGANCQQLTSGDVINKRPAWSADGKQIAFISNRDGNFEIYVVGSDGRNLRRLTITPNDQENYPAWSLDGNWIAFSLPIRGNDEIFVMTIDGQDLTNVTNNNADDFAPVWLPSTGMPTPSSMAISTPSPVPTVTPTSTPVSIGCTQEPVGEFRATWDKYKDRLGCPKQIEPTLYSRFAEQQFENGYMFWSEQPEDIVIVLTRGDKPTWYEFNSWSFVPGSSTCASEFTPGPGQFPSIHAFGGVWCDNLHIRQSLGFGTAPERGMGGAIQEFEDGFILRNDDPSQVYVLFKDDRRYIEEGVLP